MLDGAVGAAPAKPRGGKGFPKPYFNAEILRLRKERVRVLVEIKVLEREGGDTSDLWAEFRALRAKAKRESRRAKAVYWKSRNQTLAELARDPTRARRRRSTQRRPTAAAPLLSDARKPASARRRTRRTRATPILVMAATMMGRYRRAHASAPRRKRRRKPRRRRRGRRSRRSANASRRSIRNSRR